MWKPLAPVALLGKSKATEASKSSPSKVIQIEARPLPSVRSRSKPTPVAAVAVDPDLACMDHDYCIPNKGTSIGEPGKRWNVKQQSFITIKPIRQPATTTTQTPPAALALSVQANTNPTVTIKTQDFPLTESLDQRTDGMERSSVLETPDASPARQESESSVKEGSPRRGPFRRNYRRHSASRTPSPRSSPKERTGGRSRKRRSQRSPSPMSSGSESDSHSSRSRSRSRAPSKKRFGPLSKDELLQHFNTNFLGDMTFLVPHWHFLHFFSRYRPRHSESSSSSSSRSSSRSSPSVSRSPPRRRRYSYSSSRSGSWSRSSSRSRSPQRQAQWSRSRRLYRYNL